VLALDWRGEDCEASLDKQPRTPLPWSLCTPSWGDQLLRSISGGGVGIPGQSAAFPVERQVSGCCICGNRSRLPIAWRSTFPPRAPSHQYTPGRMVRRGNYLPPVLHPPGCPTAHTRISWARPAVRTVLQVRGSGIGPDQRLHRVSSRRGRQDSNHPRRKAKGYHKG